MMPSSIDAATPIYPPPGLDGDRLWERIEDVLQALDKAQLKAHALPYPWLELYGDDFDDALAAARRAARGERAVKPQTVFAENVCGTDFIPPREEKANG